MVNAGSGIKQEQGMYDSMAGFFFLYALTSYTSS